MSPKPEFEMQKLMAYSYAAVLFDESKDIISSFSPLIEYIIINSGKTVITWKNLVSMIDTVYHTVIPTATLYNLLNLIEQKGIIKFDDNNSEISIIDKSKISIKQDSISNYLQELFEAFCAFLQDKGEKIDCDLAKDIICSFIFNNADILPNLIKCKGMASSTEFCCETSDQSLHNLIEFILTIREENSNSYKALLLLYTGATQACLLNLTTEEIEKVEKSELKGKKIILDTNFIMRLLDIQNSYECAMAKETFWYIQKLNAEIVVLPCSIREVQKSIELFLQQVAPYSAKTGEFLRHVKIRTTGILAAYQRGKTKTDLLAISNNIESLLTGMGIVIDKDDQLDEDFDEELLQSLMDAKGYSDRYTRIQAKHDIHLIEYCRKNRVSLCNSIVDTECFILTNDLKLTQWNQTNCIETSFHECVSEVQLANLFWLQRKTTSNEGIINIVIALANQYDTDTRQLLSFITKLTDYQKTGASATTTTAIVHANNMITSSDIARINAEELGIESLYNSKFEIAQKEKHGTQESIANIEEENKKLQESIHSADAQTRELKEHAEKDKLEKRDLRESIDVMKLEIQNSKEKSEKETKKIRLLAEEKKLCSYKMAKLVYENSVRVIVILTLIGFLAINWFLIKCIPEAVYSKMVVYLHNDTITFLASYLTCAVIVSGPITFIVVALIAGELTRSPAQLLQIISAKITKKITKSIFGMDIQVTSRSQIEKEILEIENDVSILQQSMSSELENVR